MAWFLWFIIWAIVISSNLSEADYPHGIPESQYEALYDLYDSTNGENWNWKRGNATTRWSFTNPVGNPCTQDWQGLTCQCPRNNPSYCVISIMRLERYRLVGFLPESMSNLQNLTFLNLQANNLTGPIPSSFGLFNQLLEIYLDSNQLISIPDTLYNCSKLQILSLTSNTIHGTISPLIGKLSQLNTLYLENNYFTGTIPEEFANLKLLTDLDLSNNQFFGSIPDNFPFSKLNILSLEQNLFSSSLPLGFSSANQLTEILLYNNSFTGEFVVSNPSSPEFLWIYNNFFSGNLSSMQDFHNVSKLWSFIIYSNQFTGDLPTCSQSCMSGFIYYETTSNYFTNAIPLEFSYFPFDLNSFDIASNFLIGSILPNFTACQDLFYFNISYNLLTGTIPNNFLPFAYEGGSPIILSNNFFTGTLPLNYQQFELATELDFSNNYLSGIVPQAYNKLIHLKEFYIQNNYFNGCLNNSLQVMNDLNLINLDFSNNQFTGSIPSEFFQNIARQSLKTFSISINCLTGFLPNDICNGKKLTTQFSIRNDPNIITN